MRKVTFYFILFLLLAGCDCDESIRCEGLSDAATRVLDAPIEGTEFTNGSDSTLSFLLIFYQRTMPSNPACYEDLYSGACQCEDTPCPTISGSKSFEITPAQIDIESRSVGRSWLVTDSTGTYRKDTLYYIDTEVRYNSYSIYISNNTINYRFLDSQFFIPLREEQNNLLFQGDSLKEGYRLLTAYDTPNRTYQQVIEVTNPQRFTGQPSLFISKIYCDLNNGVIAFEGKQNELFYLTD